MLFNIKPGLFSSIALMFALAAGAQLKPFHSNYKVGYRNASGLTVVQPLYDAGSDMKEGFAVVMRGNKRGYLNARGEETIPCQYEDAALFDGGLACVRQNGRYGFINTSGQWAIQPIYENAFSFDLGLARVSRNGKWGVIDRRGTMVIPLIYTRLGEFSDGLMAASQNGTTHGYINAKGEIVVRCQFLDAGPFDILTHKAVVVKGESAYYINRKGDLLERLPTYEEHEAEERKEQAEKN